MLLFWDRNGRGYQGYETEGGSDLLKIIIEAGHFEDFRDFLKGAGLDSNIDFIKFDNAYRAIYTFQNDQVIDFWNSASTGTKALTLFYYWLQQIKYGANPPSLVFIDEFDAFYHNSLAAHVIKELKNISKCQFVLTAHNTSIMTNDLLRPDCYFLMYKDRLQSLADSTDKELRVAHNLEKIYRAGIKNE
jgi:AAA15 family ATPase/GTPase